VPVFTSGGAFTPTYFKLKLLKLIKKNFNLGVHEMSEVIQNYTSPFKDISAILFLDFSSTV
jgi:hypothetical protein